MVPSAAHGAAHAASHAASHAVAHAVSHAVSHAASHAALHAEQFAVLHKISSPGWWPSADTTHKKGKRPSPLRAKTLGLRA